MKFPVYDPEAGALVAPSILAADFSRLGEEVRRIEETASVLHIDVMDGRFVPNISFGTPVMDSLRPLTKLPFDVHLMIESPEQYIDAFAKAGADSITVHAETCPHLHRTLQQIHEKGICAGVSLNPSTPLSWLEEILPYADMILLMSVNPGFGGQKFIPETTDKIRRLRAMIGRIGKPVHIQVDGGVSSRNAGELFEAGANVFVAGSAIFKSSDPAGEIRAIQAACAR